MNTDMSRPLTRQKHCFIPLGVGCHRCVHMLVCVWVSLCPWLVWVLCYTMFNDEWGGHDQQCDQQQTIHIVQLSWHSHDQGLSHLWEGLGWALRDRTLPFLLGSSSFAEGFFSKRGIPVLLGGLNPDNFPVRLGGLGMGLVDGLFGLSVFLSIKVSMEDAGRRIFDGSPFGLRIVGRTSLMAGGRVSNDGLTGDWALSIPVKQVSLWLAMGAACLFRDIWGRRAFEEELASLSNSARSSLTYFANWESNESSIRLALEGKWAWYPQNALQWKLCEFYT